MAEVDDGVSNIEPAYLRRRSHGCIQNVGI
jgi:hypothetical protein